MGDIHISISAFLARTRAFQKKDMGVRPTQLTDIISWLGIGPHQLTELINVMGDAIIEMSVEHRTSNIQRRTKTSVCV